MTQEEEDIIEEVKIEEPEVPVEPEVKEEDPIIEESLNEEPT
jgi:hypothetical protein